MTIPTVVDGTNAPASWGNAVASELNEDRANWTAYTPGLSGTGWALGAGVLGGRYKKIGRNEGRVQTRLKLGTGFTAGTGQLTLSLPAGWTASAASDSPTIRPRNLGDGLLIVNASGNTFRLMCIASSTSILGLVHVAANGQLGGLVAGSPVTYAVNDTIEFDVRMELV